MHSQSFTPTVALFVASVTCTATLAQPAPDGQRRSFTPEQREEFYQRAIDRNVERLTSAYELTDAQQQAVRQRFAQIREADRANSEIRRQQMETLRDQMRQLRERRDAGEQVDPQQWRAFGEQMGSLFRNSPLMNSDNLAAEVEKLLPQEQAAKGRERMRRESDRRSEEMRQRWQDWQTRGGGDPGEFRRDRSDRGDRGSRRGRDRNDAPGAPRQPDAAGQTPPNAGAGDSSDRPNFLPAPDDENNDRRRRRDRRRDETRNDESPNTVEGWQRYVRNFSRRYALDPSQRELADSILRDAVSQRRAYEDMHKADITAAQALQDAKERQQQLDALNGPVAQLFTEMKVQLERVPTAAQKQAAQAANPTSRPASATRPATNADSSAGEGRRGRSRDRSRRPPAEQRNE